MPVWSVVAKREMVEMMVSREGVKMIHTGSMRQRWASLAWLPGVIGEAEEP